MMLESQSASAVRDLLFRAWEPVERGKVGNQRGPGAGRPTAALPPDPVLLRTLVESIGRQRSNRSDGKSRVNPVAGAGRIGPTCVGENQKVVQNVVSSTKVRSRDFWEAEFVRVPNATKRRLLQNAGVTRSVKHR